MIERPLPFFGAGPEAFAVSLFLLTVGVNFGGLFSMSTLISVLLAVAVTSGISYFREIDPFGVESFVSGAITPSYFQKGTDFFEDPSSCFKSRPGVSPS